MSRCAGTTWTATPRRICRVHGGPYKAVYLYPAEHYAAWRQELPDMALPWGMFGENFTTEGISEATMQIGDRLRIGTAVVRVMEPRIPCYKLGLRFGRDDMLKRLLASGRTGLYVAVEHEGEVEAGDTGPPDVLVEDWEANHACCCTLHLDRAAQGDTKTLNTIRTCMGLPGVSSTPLGSP